jgi:cell division transport system permease protein
MNRHLLMMRSATDRIFGSPLNGFLNILVIGIALSLPAGTYVLMQNSQELLAQLTGTPQISLFLAMDAASDDIASIREKLTKYPGIKHVEFVSRTQALITLGKDSGLSDVIAGMDSNPLPDAFVITPESASAKSLEALRNDLQKIPKVDLTQLDSAWAYKLEATLNVARIAILILATLLSLGLIAITFNTIRLQILTQRDEILVSKLIGATDAFIRSPFLYFGAIQGLLGGLAAELIIIISLQLLNQPLATLSGLYGSSFSLRPLSLGDSLSLLVFSTYLGWLGAWLSVVRHLTQGELR